MTFPTFGGIKLLVESLIILQLKALKQPPLKPCVDFHRTPAADKRSGSRRPTLRLAGATPANTNSAQETAAEPITQRLIYSWAACSSDHQATGTPMRRDTATNWAQINLSAQLSLERVITRPPAHIFYCITKETTRSHTQLITTDGGLAVKPHWHGEQSLLKSYHFPAFLLLRRDEAVISKSSVIVMFAKLYTTFPIISMFF